MDSKTQSLPDGNSSQINLWIDCNPNQNSSNVFLKNNFIKINKLILKFI